ncbi:uncharacterized protein RHIMIDRAFT_266755 [Rhizopus microsporus ATCC 52813]|uniref:Uncharacterized protein n=1 Tax=Rhizopus microsporus ATCC 52813 TaxID=1340429 RepID=A0A2G4T6V7_RHIZD|nr:uncharacterized protein RHIMIDRAFT_266755 [Rhizopus microsporus ATCC 52813]PHZ16752.1 hypothetical protein RHIMIDRAFT_266755 [Rhizopus microsporus ATCC 52813]
MRVISAALFVLGSFMVTSTVGQACFRICAPNRFNCPQTYESKQFGMCWTCCSSKTSS